MSAELTAAIVRILGPEGRTAGTGFVVADRAPSEGDGPGAAVIITCAHVVQHAGSRPSSTVGVAFWATGQVHEARVEPDGWRPVQAEDIAVLWLEGSLPEGVSALPLSRSEQSVDHRYETFGFATSGPDDGLQGSGWIMRATTIHGTPVLQLRSSEVTPGFDGAPVWDRDAKRVVGMITSIAPSDRYSRLAITALATPAEDLVKAWPSLKLMVSPVKLSSVPCLPRHYLPRPEELTALKWKVMGGSTAPYVAASRSKAVVVHGVGGIGKSVLAASLARDEEVGEAFPDGIYWLKLGRKPWLPARQAQLAEALGDPHRVFEDMQQGVACLQSLLAGRACLLVLDDVWDPDHVFAFDALGPLGQLLITTRDAGLVQQLETEEHPLNLLDDVAALTLLSQAAGLGPEEVTPGQSMEVVQECGHLPLALALVGAMVRGQPDPWTQALRRLQARELRRIQRRFPEYPYPNLLKALEASVSALADDARLDGLQPIARYLDFAVFPKDTAVPLAVLETFWEPDGLDGLDVEDLAEAFVDRSLAQQDELGRLSLHDLQADYVRGRVTDLPGVQARLLAAYAARCPEGWHSGPDDGYFFQHLAHHLKMAGRNEKLYALLAGSPDWMERKFVACQGDGGYVTDLELALSDLADPLTPAQVGSLVALHTASQVVRHRVSHYTDTDLEILVRLGRAAEALSHARLRQDEKAKVEGLLIVDATLRELEDALVDCSLLDEAAAIARVVPAPEKRHATLSALATALARARREGEAETALFEAVEAARLVGLPGERAEALLPLAAALDQRGYKAQAELAFAEVVTAAKASVDSGTVRQVAAGLVDQGRFAEAEEVSRSILAEADRGKALCTLAVALLEGGRDEEADGILSWAEESVRAIPSDEVRVQAMCTLASALLEHGRETEADRILSRAEESVRAIHDGDVRAQALGELAAAFAQAGRDEQARTLFAEARELADSPESEEHRVQVLHTLVAALGRAGYLDEAIETARAIEDPLRRASALPDVVVALFEHGRDEEGGSLFAYVLATARPGRRAEEATPSTEVIETPHARERDWRQSVPLFTLARGLAEQGRFARALEAARLIGRDRIRARTLRFLVTDLAQAGHLSEAADTAASIEDEEERAEALRALAGAYARNGQREQAGALLAEAIQLVPPVRDDFQHAYALHVLAAALAGLGRLPAAAKTARLIRDPGQRAEALCILATAHFEQGHDRKAMEALVEAAETAVAMGHGQGREERLFSVALALVHAGRSDLAKKVALSVEDEHLQAKALHGVASRLAQEGYYREASEVAHSIADDLERWQAERRLAAALAQAGRFEEAMKTAHAIQDDYQQAHALRDLAAALAQYGRFDEAEELAFGIHHSDQQEYALRDLAAALAQQGCLEEAKEKVELLGDEWAPSLRELAVALAEADRDEDARVAFAMIEDSVRSVEPSPWQVLALRDLGLARARAGHETEMDATFDEAMEAALSIEAPEDRASALRDLGAALAGVGRAAEAGEAFVEAEEVARSLGSTWPLYFLTGALTRAGYYAEAANLAGALEGDERAVVLGELATTLAGAGRFAEALASLGPRDLDEFVRILAEWVPAFEQAAPGLAEAVLKEAVRVAGWFRPDWRTIYELLAPKKEVLG